MRFSNLLLCLSLALNARFVTAVAEDRHLAIRQDSSAAPLPTLSSAAGSSSPTSAPPSQTADPSESPSPTSAPDPSNTSTPPGDDENISSTPASNTTAVPSTSVQDANPSAPTIPPGSASNSTTNGTSTEKTTGESLPLSPRITPALSVGGVVLLLTGIVYGLIGVKNKWIHVFLSTAYLASVAVLVLIIYVMNPPVSNAIQGAYFVGVFMSGLIFGGGALIFKEVTEGLGCLLGGFCLSMWFLTLKSGGLITNTGGKAIFIAVFCVVCWSFSFSHYTRSYGLMFSTSFAGSTAFVLGIDCFSRGGLKEFWVYIWDLNDDLFPLNTRTYPITRGIRVQTVIIVLGTIIGMISQLRLWKVVQNRQKQRAEAEAEDVRRRDAVEEALGRHLERQNDRDRSEWEKRYGDRLHAKRSTILWSETHGDKRMSSTSTTEVDSSQESKESLEMGPLPPPVVKPPLHSSKSKRHSSITVQAIPEVEEEDHPHANQREVKFDSANSDGRSGDFSPPLSSEKFSFDHGPNSVPSTNELSKTTSKESQSQLEVPASLRPQNTKPASSKLSARLHSDLEDARSKNRNSVPSLQDIGRRSLQSLRSKSPASGDKSPKGPDFSESREALVMPASSIETHSRASSVAATMDEENEKLDMPVLDVHDNMKRDSRPPHIVLTPSHGMSFEDQLKSGLPPSPSGLSEHFDVDPEELVRPPAVMTQSYMDFETGGASKRTSGGNTEILFEDGGKSVVDASNTSNAEGLTKGALERVPSQLSNVVLSYRTNEWAKHIATAEAPVFEEPDPIMNSDLEAPAHLADPALQEQKKLEVVEKPPPLPSPVISVAPSEAGMKINPEIQPSEKTYSGPQPEAAMSTVAPTVVPVTDLVVQSPNPSSGMPSPNPEIPEHTQPQATNSNRRSFTDPAAPAPAPAATKAIRRISNPMQRQPSLMQSTPIHENYAAEFGVRPVGPNRTTSNATARNSQQFYTPSQSAMDLSQQQQFYPSAFQRTPSVTMHHNYSSPDVRVSVGNGSSPYGVPTSMAMRSETRLNDVGGKTHQPLQRNNTNESRRETLMADWRMQLANSHTTNVVPQANVDNRYAKQMLDWEADKLRKEQDRHNKARKEAAMDQSMRTQGMIDAHREVMRKMQNKANQKMTK